MARTSPVSEILVPLDGLEAADRAIAVAAQIACRTGARLHLVSVLRPAANAGAMIPGMITYPADLDAITRTSLRAHIETRAEDVELVYGVPAIYELLDGPESVADQLVAYAARRAIDLIVMRSHGRSAIGSLCFGSVGAAVIERSGLPCLLLRERHGRVVPSTRPSWGFSRILVPLDGTPESEAGIEQAMAVATQGLTQIRLLVVVPDRWVPAPGIGLDAPDTAELATARAYVEELAHRLEIRGYSAMGFTVARASISAAIADCVDAQRIDLVSISSHHRSEGDRLIFGSVIDALVHETSVPVLARRTTRVEVIDHADAACTVPVRDPAVAGTV